uniref:hypothetical protein n=1 Tax=uncultured Sphingomonas sp. TaxID=158754 RepID=UPI0035CC8D79
MKITFTEVADRIEAVLDGSLTRLDADHWLIEIFDLEGQGRLSFDPADDADRIRQAMWQLQALDLVDDEGKPNVTDDDLRAALAHMRTT